MEKKYINPNNPVYISYAWADDKHPNIEEDVENLCEILEANYIYYKRDKENLCPYRWSIQKAEEEIGEGAAIIIVISERYLKSLHCMNEWHLICKNGKIWDRVFPIVLEDAMILNAERYYEFFCFFETRKKEILAIQEAGIMKLSDVEGEAAKENFFINDLQNLQQYLKNFCNGDLSKLRENNYAIIIDQLKGFYNSNVETSSSLNRLRLT